MDITRFRQAFEELRIKSSAIDSAVNGIAFGDLEGRVTYANAAAIELTGYTLDEVLGWSVLTFADNQEEAALLFAEFLEKGSWIGEVAGRKKDGSRIVTHLSASLVRDENGKPIGTLCSFVDITRARQAFEELRIKDYAIASSINAIAFGDLDGRITYVNEAFLRLWGATMLPRSSVAPSLPLPSRNRRSNGFSGMSLSRATGRANSRARQRTDAS